MFFPFMGVRSRATLLIRPRDRNALFDGIGPASNGIGVLAFPDGTVALCTELRFKDPDLDFAVRCWLHARFGDRFSRIHDDARGVFVAPFARKPRAATYEGILSELADVGRFIDPKPPSDEEHAERAHDEEEFESYLAMIEEGYESGDRAAYRLALAAAPEDVRRAWKAQKARARREQRRVLAARANDESRHRNREAAAGWGRVSVLARPPIVRLIARDKDLCAHLNVQSRILLNDGSAIIVTSRPEGAVNEAATLADGLLRAGMNRDALGPMPFFRESLARDVVDAAASTFEEAAAVLGDRAELLPLQTHEERWKEERIAAQAWLRRSN